MKTPYHGQARIGGHRAEVDIVNVDVSRWKGTATCASGALATGGQAIVTLLEQPRPGWSAPAMATGRDDGVLQLEGNGQFCAPQRPPVEPGSRSLWVRKRPRPS